VFCPSCPSKPYSCTYARDFFNRKKTSLMGGMAALGQLGQLGQTRDSWCEVCPGDHFLART